MKRFILFFLAALASAAIAFVAAPVIAGAAITGTLLFKGVNLVATAADIPTWAALLIFTALAPSALWWFLQIFTPKVRRRLVIILIGLAVAYALITTALTNQHLVAAAHNVAASIQKLMPVKAVDPASQPWFSPAGTPLLFFVHPTTNVWAFYRAYPGAHDPATGAELQPVRPLIREQWQAEQESQRKAEMAKKEEIALTAATEKAAADAKEQQAAAERKKADEQHHELELAAAVKQQEEQRKTDETARELASEKTALENMKQQVADGQKKIEEEQQKLEIMAAAKVEQSKNDQKAIVSEDGQAARNQEVVVTATTTHYQYQRYWIIDSRGQEFGPVSTTQLQEWIAAGRAGANTPVYAEGWRGWQPLGSILPCPTPVIYYRQQSYYQIRIW